MLTHEWVQAWLDRYIEAWQSYDPAQIRALFSDDVSCQYFPFDDPIMGIEANLRYWLDDRDDDGTYEAEYHPVVVEGDKAVTQGRSRYFHSGTRVLRTQSDNIFILRFNGAGECVEFREWWVEQPNGV